MARGAFPDSHPQHLGMPGMHGTVAAVAGLQRSDLIISLGARFDDRVTGNLDSFAPGARIIHADIDPAEIGKNRAVDVPIVGDCREVISDLVVALRAEADAGHTGDYEEWVDFLAGIKKRYPLGYDQPDDGTLAPQYVIERLGKIAGPEAIYVAGVGQHQMWAAHFVGYENPGTWINSGGLGTMGFSVPAAMGAKVGRPDTTVWSIDGDGCFQMTNQELATCAINDIPIKVAIINNESLGMVRQWQTLFYNERYSNTDLHSHSGSRTSSSSPRPTAASASPASRPTRSTRPSRRRWRSTTSRSWSTSGCTATRWCGRWSPPAPATTTSSTRATSPPSSTRTTCDMTHHTLSVLVENKPGVLARIAGLFAAAATTSTPSPSARPSTTRSRG